MSTTRDPLVSVLTPVYNGEMYLAECIQSVLRQSYTNFEYIIVNNCSTDRTLEIALAFKEKDPRIRIHNNEDFVDVISNHNLAFKLISDDAKYCKVVSADDFIYPQYLSLMVGLAEAHPSVAIVGSYQQSGSRVRWQGFHYPDPVLPGREVGRQIFLGDDRSLGHGSPTSLLYRADVVRRRDAFYPNPSPHSDTSACFDVLRNTDFGFVYQVLSYERVHDESQSSTSAVLNRYSSANVSDVIHYGPYYMTAEETRTVLKKHLSDYYRFLAVSAFRRRTCFVGSRGYRGKAHQRCAAKMASRQFPN